METSFGFPSEKEEDVRLVNGYIAKGVWEKIASSKQYQKIESMELEELQAHFDPTFFPEGFLDEEPSSPKQPSPPKKKLKLSLSSKKPRFAAPVTAEKLHEAAEGVVLDNTKKTNAWAVNTFTAWSKERNKLIPEDPVPEDLLSCHDLSIVSKYMRCFVLEARNQAGEKYPPSTSRSILCGLNRVLKEGKAPFSILDKSDHHFRELLLTLDTVTSDLHSLHREGIGVPVDATQPWYCKSRVGVNTLRKFVPDISTNAGLSVRYTNHSL